MMRIFYLLSVSVLFLIFTPSCEAQTSEQQEKKSVDQPETVNVYYFHFTRRCVTCQAVETEAREAIETIYPQLVDENRIIFKSVNIEKEEGRQLADQFGVTGQSLLIVNGDDKIDLVREGFMYARTAPDKFRQAIKQQIDGML